MNDFYFFSILLTNLAISVTMSITVESHLDRIAETAARKVFEIHNSLPAKDPGDPLDSPERQLAHSQSLSILKSARIRQVAVRVGLLGYWAASLALFIRAILGELS